MKRPLHGWFGRRGRAATSSSTARERFSRLSISSPRPAPIFIQRQITYQLNALVCHRCVQFTDTPTVMALSQETHKASQEGFSPVFSLPTEIQAERQEGRHGGGPHHHHDHHHGGHGTPAPTGIPRDTTAILAEIETTAVLSSSKALSMHCGRVVDGSVISTCEHRGGVVAVTEKISSGSDTSLHHAEALQVQGCRKQLPRCQLWSLVKVLAILAALEAAVILIITRRGQVCVCVCMFVADVLSPFPLSAVWINVSRLCSTRTINEKKRLALRCSVLLLVVQSIQ